MWHIHFTGFFQCRLATDSDDFDDPRGQNGWTFAFDGDPDLDRVVRLQAPVGARSFVPEVGVAVVDVNGDAAHGLVGARVSLLEHAKFEGRNGLIAPAGKEPIAPFVLAIEKDGFNLMRRDDYNVANAIERRPHLGLGVGRLSPAEAAALGLADPVAFRVARRAALEAALPGEADPTKRANLIARIAQLQQFNSASDIQMFSLTFKVPYAHQLRHAGALVDPGGLLPGVSFAVPWEISYWLGAWDADALQGFLNGTVSIAE